MSSLPYWITRNLPQYHVNDRDRVAAEQEQIKERAFRYDRLVNELGFIDYRNVMKDKIDSEISEATKYTLEPEKQRIHVIRWNAMRELLDAAESDILETRKERDRIKQEEYAFFSMQANQEKIGEVNE